MLPFLKKKNAHQSGVIINDRQPDQDTDNTEEIDHEGMLDACAQALITAVEDKNVPGVREAIRDMFTIMESEPHVEGEHIEPHSYEAQNIKAGLKD